MTSQRARGSTVQQHITQSLLKYLRTRKIRPRVPTCYLVLYFSGSYVPPLEILLDLPRNPSVNWLRATCHVATTHTEDAWVARSAGRIRGSTKTNTQEPSISRRKSADSNRNVRTRPFVSVVLLPASFHEGGRFHTLPFEKSTCIGALFSTGVCPGSVHAARLCFSVCCSSLFLRLR